MLVTSEGIRKSIRRYRQRERNEKWYVILDNLDYIGKYKEENKNIQAKREKKAETCNNE